MAIFYALLIIVVDFAIVAILFTFVLAGISAAPWVPLWKSDIRRMLKLADLKEGEILYDLGSGDGRILIIAAKEFDAQATGFEISVLLYFISCIKILIANFKSKYKIKVRYQNFYRADLSQADVISVFLTPMAMKKLQAKFSTSLKSGCRIVSYAFSIPNWRPDEVSKPAKNKTSIYLYKIK